MAAVTSCENTPLFYFVLYSCCDKCDDWFHGDCIGITKLEAKEIKQFYCRECLGELPTMFWQ